METITTEGQESKETIGIRVTEDKIKTLIELLPNAKDIKVDITGCAVTVSFLLNNQKEEDHIKKINKFIDKQEHVKPICIMTKNRMRSFWQL